MNLYSVDYYFLLMCKNIHSYIEIFIHIYTLYENLSNKNLFFENFWLWKLPKLWYIMLK